MIDGYKMHYDRALWYFIIMNSLEMQWRRDASFQTHDWNMQSYMEVETAFDTE